MDVREDPQGSQSIPEGYCQCGCGKKTNIAPRTYKRRGVTQGQPLRFIFGHHTRKEPIVPPNPSGKCLCGCGAETSLAKRTTRGNVRGLPRKYVDDHARLHQRHNRYHEEYRGYDTPCWIWDGCLNESESYGIVGSKGARKMAHRYFYEKEWGAGAIKGLQLHHECEVKSCVRPSHMNPLTPQEHTKLHAILKRESAEGQG